MSEAATASARRTAPRALAPVGMSSPTESRRKSAAAKVLQMPTLATKTTRRAYRALARRQKAWRRTMAIYLWLFTAGLTLFGATTVGLMLRAVELVAWPGWLIAMPALLAAVPLMMLYAVRRVIPIRF